MRKFALCIIVTIFQYEIFAQEIHIPVNLRDMINLSFQYYPKVIEMNDLVQLGEFKVRFGRAGYLPIINGDVSYRRLYPISPLTIPIGPGQSKEIYFMPADNYNAGVTLTQPLIDLKTSANINKAKNDLKTSTDNLESFKMQLAYQIAQIYYGIIFLNKNIYVQQKQLDLLKSNLQQIEAKIKNGDALDYDLVSMQVRYTNTENYYTDLVAQINKQYNMLHLLTGNKNTTICDTIIDLTAFDIAVDSLLKVASDNNPDIKVARDKVEAAYWDVVSANRSRLPTVNLTTGTGYKNGFMPDIDNMRFNYAVGVGITIPIMPATHPRLQKKSAIINVDVARHELETQIAILTKDVFNALEDVKKNEKKLSGSDVQVQQAQLAFDLATERYKAGVITNLEFLTAQTNYQDALLSKLQFEYNLLLSKMEVCRLAGQKWW